jgi:hypothetical protein
LITAFFALSILLFVAIASAANFEVVVYTVDKHVEPIEDANVKFVNASSEDDTWDENTNSDGKASIDLPEDEDYDLTITHGDYQSFEDGGFIDGLDDDLEYTILLRPAETTLEILVLDEDDEEVEEAEVSVESLDEGVDKEEFEDADYTNIIGGDYEAFDYDKTDETDSKGIAEFKSVETDTDYNVTVRKGDYITVWQVVSLKLGDDYTDDDAIEIQLVAPGDSRVTVVAKEAGTEETIQGARVVVVNRNNLDQTTETTGSNGEVVLSLETPVCYDIMVTKERYGQDSQTNICLENNDDRTLTFSLTAQNNPPVARAGLDLFVMQGSSATIDGSASDDSDNDTLTYMWVDSLGTSIPPEEMPVVTFDILGVHEITLTVSDGELSSTDIVLVTVESPENCGNGICSEAERLSGTCPTDCPTCKDGTCAVGEDVRGEAYCPVDCSIAVRAVLRNATPLMAGNTTIIVSTDMNTGDVVPRVTLSVTAPNGSITPLVTDARGEAIYTFSAPGRYNITAGHMDYAASTVTVTVHGGGDSGLLLVVVIVVLIILFLFFIRWMNMKKRGGGWAKKGKYRRGKSTLSSV